MLLLLPPRQWFCARLTRERCNSLNHALVSTLLRRPETFSPREASVPRTAQTIFASTISLRSGNALSRYLRWHD